MSYPSPHSGWQSNPYQQLTQAHGYGVPIPIPPSGYGYPPGSPKKRNTSVVIAVIYGGVDHSRVNEMLNNSSGANTEQILEDELDVTFGTFTRDRSYSSLTVGKLPVTVKNKGSERATTYHIEIEGVDANGDRIAEDTLYVSNLAPGESVTKDVFTTSVDDYTELTRATFRVAGVSKY
jgi:hypothetical protein